MEDKPKSVIFFHPDLGIGGAERLIIDAALGLQNRGRKVVIFTSHCDPKHCFEEARDGTLDVRVRGNWLIPPSILTRFSILCAILRQLHLIIATYFTSELSSLNPDAFVADQLSAGLPLLRLFYPETRILFYTHFPDLLLARGRSAWWKRVYRMPFDFIEKWSMSFADSVAVNSGFTKSVVTRVWPELARKMELHIIYPCVDVREKREKDGEEMVSPWSNTSILLSINRFDRQKDIGLAIKAFAGLGKNGREGVRLLCAGGYDNRVQENVLYHKELVELAESLGLKTATTKTIVTALNVPEDVDVLFLLSVPSAMKEMLLTSARLLVYTPPNEHFGIVPLEAMLAGTPVLAANQGGPLETIVEGQTGWLRASNDPESWTQVMKRVLHDMSDEEIKAMGEAGVDRVRREFSDTKMAERFDLVITGMTGRPRRNIAELCAFFLTILVLFCDTTYYLAAQYPEIYRRVEKLLAPPFTLTVLSIISWGAYWTISYSAGRTEQKGNHGRRRSRVSI